jgi:hypothetical protein
LAAAQESGQAAQATRGKQARPDRAKKLIQDAGALAGRWNC